MNIQRIFEQLTTQEKATLLTGKRNWWFHGVERLGIRDFVVGDGPHGLRAYKDLNEHGGHPRTNEPATMFPSASGMASSWNEKLLHQVGETIGNECNHYGVDVILAPGMNGKRSPLGGRNFEYYSEDPLLTAKMATAFVKGVQSRGVGTSVKHFVLNEQESARRFISSQVDSRPFRELYAYPFEQVIKHANPLTIMGSYNKINGIYACQNPELLRTLLRTKWGYEGIVISDWGAVQDKSASVYAGLDIEMPESEWKNSFIQDVMNGKYDMGVINEAVLRILKAYDFMLENPHYGQKTNFEDNHLIAQKVASESICLLKNDEQILPLKTNEPILVLGDFAESPRINGGGSSELLPYRVENPLLELKKYLDVKFIPGYQLDETKIEALQKYRVVLIFTGTTAQIESEGFDRKDLNLPTEQTNLILSASNWNSNIVVVNSSGSAIEAASFIHLVKGFVQTWFLGSACGRAIADILFGTINPSGKLSETFPIRIENTPTYSTFPGRGIETKYEEGLFTGYRYYDTHQAEVLFPFGYGLSYTTFAYKNGHISTSILKNNESIDVTIEILNAGLRQGKEVVECYIEYPQKEFIHPKKYLKAFQKVELLPNEQKSVTFTLTDEHFSVYSPVHDAFLVENGDYVIHIGSSVSNIHFMSKIHFESRDVCHVRKAIDFPCDSWLADEPEKTILEGILKQYRRLHWWETEEPLERVLKRLVQEKGDSLAKYEELLVTLGTKK